MPWKVLESFVNSCWGSVYGLVRGGSVMAGIPMGKQSGVAISTSRKRREGANADTDADEVLLQELSYGRRATGRQPTSVKMGRCNDRGSGFSRGRARKRVGRDGYAIHRQEGRQARCAQVTSGGPR